MTDLICCAGHPITPDNAKPTKTGIRCRECHRAYNRRYYERRKQQQGRFWKRAKVIPDARFWTLIQKDGEDGCWQWVGLLDGAGYGVFARYAAHRVAYETLVGPIPPGLQLDHLCVNPPCVNPAHLEPVTSYENTRRARLRSEGIDLNVTCKQGHPWTPETTGRTGEGYRFCRECSRVRSAARYARLKAGGSGE